MDLKDILGSGGILGALAMLFWISWGLRGIVAKVDILDKRIDALNANMSSRFEGVAKCLEIIDNRFDKIEDKLQKIQEDTGHIKSRLDKLEVRVEERTIVRRSDWTRKR